MTQAATPSLATVDDVRRELAGKPLRGTSRGRAWPGVAVDEFGSYRAERMVVGPRDHHILSVNLEGSSFVRQERCGRIFESPGLPGEASLIPSGFGSRWDGLLPTHISLRFSPDALLETMAELRNGRAARAELSNGFRVRDPFISSIGSLFSLELSRASHPAQEIVIESLTAALMMHLVRGYTNAIGVEARSSLGVGLGALRRAITYVEDQPDSRITLDGLAAAAGLSRFHFGRLFKQHIGVTPAQYVERSRIERAKTLIRRGELSLIDIAHTVGFSDQSHFTRRFRHHEGCTPGAYAREHRLRLPPDIAR